MSLPNEIPTVRVTGTYKGPDGRALKGTVTFTGPPLLTFAESDLFIAGPVVASLDEKGQIIDADGNVGVHLPATDAPNMNPSGWTWTVKENLTGITGSRTYSMVLPRDTPLRTVDLADVAPADPGTPTYVAVPGLSAYEIAVLNGFVGPESDWVASLKGDKGDPGVVQSVNGKSAADISLTAADVNAVEKTGGTFTGTVRIDTAQHGLTSKSTVTAAGHAITAWMAATSGTGSALNAVSDNPKFSTVQVSGREEDTGTIKVTHAKPEGASDAGAAALSIDLTGEGTAAQALFINSSTPRADGVPGTTGNVIVVRNTKGREDFKLSGNGRVSMGAAVGYNPSAYFDMRMPDQAVPGIVVRAAAATGANMTEWQRSSDGSVRTRISALGQIVTLETLYAAGLGMQIGSTSVTFGGGSGVLGIANAGVEPTATAIANGGALYAKDGALYWIGSNGTKTLIAPA